MSTEADELALFHVMLGCCLDSARLGHATVRLELEDGGVVEGRIIQSAIAESESEGIDHTGTRRQVTVGDTLVDLEGVRRYCVVRPG